MTFNSCLIIAIVGLLLLFINGLCYDTDTLLINILFIQMFGVYAQTILQVGFVYSVYDSAML